MKRYWLVAFTNGLPDVNEEYDSKQDAFARERELTAAGYHTVLIADRKRK